MTVLFEDLSVLRTSEEVADALWAIIVKWEHFYRDTIGKQMARAVDSIGANIAESYGRFHFGEKLQFLYYARGSLYETKYWLNRSHSRNLLSKEFANDFAQKLSNIAHQLNALAKTTKKQRKSSSKTTLREQRATYKTNFEEEADNWQLFTQIEIDSLAVINFPNNPIT